MPCCFGASWGLSQCMFLTRLHHCCWVWTSCVILKMNLHVSTGVAHSGRLKQETLSSQGFSRWTVLEMHSVSNVPRTTESHVVKFCDQGANHKNIGHTFLNVTTALLMTVAATGDIGNQFGSPKVVEMSTQRDSSLLEAVQRQGLNAERLTMWSGFDLATEASAQRSVQFLQSCQ